VLVKVWETRVGTDRLRRCAVVVCYCWMALAVVGLAAADESVAPRPNIVFIMADDMGWADVGYQGAMFYETPNIDRLARDGRVFTRFYPGGANCAPSRACILTGTYSPRTMLYQPGGKSKGPVRGMRFKVPSRNKLADASFNTIVSRVDSIEPGFVSIAEVLSAAGYATARIGKWHLGQDTQGFDLSTSTGDLNRKDDLTGMFYKSVGEIDTMLAAADAFIDKHKASAFLLYVSLWEVHEPHIAKRQIVDRYRRKKAVWDAVPGEVDWDPAYAAEVEVVDQAVGHIRAKLESLGIADDTLIVFTSDNGAVPGVSPNTPLRAGKGSLFEGGIRTPAVAYWPGVTPAGSSCDTPVHGVDMLPTFADLAGALLPGSQPIDGRSIKRLLSSQDLDSDLAERSIFWHYPLYLVGGEGNRVLPLYGTDHLYWRAVPSSAMVKGDWKLIEYYEYDRAELFNLAVDPGETSDLSGVETERTALMRAELQNWVTQTGAPVPTQLNPLFKPRFWDRKQKKNKG